MPCLRTQAGFERTFSDCESNTLATRLVQLHTSTVYSWCALGDLYNYPPIESPPSWDTTPHYTPVYLSSLYNRNMVHHHRHLSRSLPPLLVDGFHNSRHALRFWATLIHRLLPASSMLSLHLLLSLPLTRFPSLGVPSDAILAHLVLLILWLTTVNILLRIGYLSQEISSWGTIPFETNDLWDFGTQTSLNQL